ncbi:hypothetical protein A343_0649 [Porphyromonas gingivalis JCVI SC001]|uniref:Uncharacterized protein n=1 Tax=Porphyromonas gingivalis F0570 TaxID=1227271 RepID=A0A0E2LRW4_PORGN|nr:hypothetical protein A343_0649 [Porphyromonas gingivalis JCVI SC001]ERJ68010.1 hypothetical protein HMPREF1555_00631 [Porphyromonas gingivalis F0570]
MASIADIGIKNTEALAEFFGRPCLLDTFFSSISLIRFIGLPITFNILQ